MTLAERVAAALAALAPTGQPEQGRALRELLSQISHDAKSPLATFNMELYMLGRIATEMRAALKAGELDGLAAQIDEVASICDNLKEATTRGLGVVNTLDQAVTTLRGEGA